MVHCLSMCLPHFEQAACVLKGEVFDRVEKLTLVTFLRHVKCCKSGAQVSLLRACRPCVAQIDVYALVILQLVHGVLLLSPARSQAMVDSPYAFAFEAIILALAFTIRFARPWCAA